MGADPAKIWRIVVSEGNRSSIFQQIFSKSMGRSKLRLDTRRPLQDGTYPVQIKVGFGTNLYLATGIYLAREDWDERLQVCTGKSARRINNILGNLLLQTNNRILELRETGQFGKLTAPQLRQMLTNLDLTAPTIGVPSVGSYITRVGELKTDHTKLSYITLYRRLADYCDVENLRFTDLSYAWYEAFVRKLENEWLKRNTIAKYLKTLKTVIKYAEDDGLQVNPAYKKIDSRAESDTPMRNLPIQTLRRIRDTEIKGKTAYYKDAFLLSFYLIGINMADLLALRKENVVNGRIQYKRAKTGKNYSVKIEPEAQAIIDKYPGKDHLLNFGEKVKGFRQNCNSLLCSLEPGLTWYWARYSWANYAVDLDIPKDTISECLGHSHGSPVTGVYIKYSLDKVDKANRQVLDYFKGKE